MENKETINADLGGTPGITPQSTSTLISSDTRVIPVSQLDQYYREATGMTLTSYLANQVTGAITNVIKEAIGKKLKPKFLGIYNLIFDVADICSAINQAMTALELGSAICDVYTKNGSGLKVVVKNYEWLSGSGNHVSYYSTIDYYTSK